jgi:leader peptidase (prepilin peptidase)/N-methyltransferase
MSASWSAVALSAALAVAVSPLLASWSASLAGAETATWWRPRRVDRARLVVVGFVALGFGALAGGGGPWLAWWLLAAGGTVLAVVDAQRNLLPARFVYPLALLEAIVLVAATVSTHDFAGLVRAGLAVLVVGAGWFLLAFAAGGGIGLGDVRLAALLAGLLGWLGWAALMRAQIAIIVLVMVTATVVALVRPELRGRDMPVPLGPALVVGTLAMCWAC